MGERNGEMVSRVELSVVRLRDDAALPRQASAGAAGMDLAAALDAPLHLASGEWKAVPTGIAIALPAGHEGQVRPRSGLAARHGITVLNAPGTIDEDYRGELQVLLINHGTETFVVEHGDRIAQLVVARVTAIDVIERQELDATTRGTAGFGSTGVSS